MQTHMLYGSNPTAKGAKIKGQKVMLSAHPRYGIATAYGKVADYWFLG